jgi:mono/diheme cytochrome c family protein
MMTFSRALIPAAVALVAAAAVTTQAAFAADTFTDAQAKSGATIYTAQCSMCHGVKLEGVSGPALAGSAFITKWSGQSADDVRDIIANQMPLTAPGSLKPAEVLSVLAYILAQNNYVAGPTALTAAGSKKLKIAKQ